MSVIASFYNTTVTITRTSVPSPTGGNVATTVGSAFGVFRIESEPQKLFVANNLGKEFDFYTDEIIDIAIGDQLTTGSDTYDVKAVSSYEDLLDDSDSYLKCRVVKHG